MPSKTCLGMIAAFCSQTSENRNGPNGCFRWKTTVCGSELSIVSITLPAGMNFGPYLALVFISDQATSSDVTGLPSSHFDSSRWNV